MTDTDAAVVDTATETPAAESTEATQDASQEVTDSVPEPESPEPGAQSPAPASSDVPIHLALCQVEGCAVRVTYRPIATDPGFFILERSGYDSATAILADQTGMLVCPHGHGPLTLADEQLVPVSDAISQVAEQVAQEGPPDRRLPFAVPPFNFEGALRDLFRMRHDIKAQETKVARAHERYKKEKADLDEMTSKLGVAIDDYEQREQERQYEQERRARGLPASGDSRLVRCAWEQRNPGKSCPICTDALNERRQAPGSEGHAVEVHEFLTTRELEQCIRELLGVPVFGVTLEYLRALPMELSGELQCWSGDVADHPDERERWLEGGLPRGLRSPHIAGRLGTMTENDIAVQHCKACGTKLPGRECEEVYPEDAFVLVVGDECPGEEQEAARTIRRHKKTPPAKKPAASKKGKKR